MAAPAYSRRSPNLLAFLLAGAAWGEHRIHDFSFRQYEGGPSWADGYEPASGDTVCVEFRVTGLATKEGEFDDLFGYEYTLTAVDGRNGTWAAPARSKVEGTISDEDKESGLAAKDLRLLRDAAAACAPRLPDPRRRARPQRERNGPIRSEFRLRRLPVAPSPSIAVQRFRFLREEEDRDPLQIAAYRPGDTVWGRFEMTGFSLKPDLVADVAYGLAVFNASGRKMFELSVAAEESRKFAYPPDYLPGVVSLSLQRNTPAGEYRIELTVTDRASGLKSITTHAFRIE